MEVFAHFSARENPIFLPEKWAKTSIVTVLLQLIIPQYEPKSPYESVGPCSVSNELTISLKAIFLSPNRYFVPAVHRSNDPQSLALTMRGQPVFGVETRRT